MIKRYEPATIDSSLADDMIEDIDGQYVRYEDHAAEVNRILAKQSEATSLLRRIADAGVIFPSVCSNNMEAMNLVEALQAYRSDHKGLSS